MVGLAERSNEPELMDTEPVSFAEFQDCLRDLETINRLTLAYRPTLRWLDRAASRLPKGRPVTLLDVGSGHGDMLRRIWRWADRRGIPIALTGLDLNPWSVKAASAATPADAPIRYEQRDIFAIDKAHRFDLIISALFAHHLTDADLLRFIGWMEAHARTGWFVNDIHRHLVPYHFIKHATRLARLNRMVVHDAPVSVARAFRRQDWQALLDRAGIAGAEIAWHLPFRYGVGRLK